MTTVLRVVDGGRTEPRRKQATITCCGDEIAGEALCGLLDGAGAAPGVEFNLVRAPAAPGRKSGAREAAVFDVAFQHPRDRSDAAGDDPDDASSARPAATWSTAVVGMKGLARTMSPSLNFRIVAASAMNAAALAEPVALAKAENRTRAAVVIGDGAEAAAARAYRDLRPVFGGNIRIDGIAAAEAALQVARDAFAGDLLVAPPRDAETISAVAHHLAGDCWLAARTWFTGSHVRTAAGFAVGAGRSRAGSVEAAIAAGADFLAALEFFEAAARLRDALMKTLEDNLHTEAAPLIAPYTRALNAYDFIRAVHERLGEKPVRFPATSYGSHAHSRRRDGGAGRLRLAHSA